MPDLPPEQAGRLWASLFYVFDILPTLLPASHFPHSTGLWLLGLGNSTLQPHQPQRRSLDSGWANVGPYTSSQSDHPRCGHRPSPSEFSRGMSGNEDGNTVSGPAFPGFAFMNLLAYVPYCLLKCKVVQAGCSSCTTERPPSNTRSLAEWEIALLSLSSFIRMFIGGTLCARPEIGWWANIGVTDILVRWDYGLLGRTSIQWWLKVHEFQVFNAL